MIFQPSPTQNPLKNPKNDPPFSVVALITSITRDFLSFLGGSSFFLKNDDPPQNGPGITSTPKIVKKWGFLGIVMGFS